MGQVLFNIISFLSFWEFLIMHPNSTHFLGLPYPPVTRKIKSKQNKNPVCSPIFPTSSFILVALGVTPCLAGDPFIQPSVTCGVYCSDSLGWFKVFQFLIHLISGSSRELLSYLAGIVPQDRPLHELQQVTGGLDVRVGLGGSRARSLGPPASGERAELSPLHPCH